MADNGENRDARGDQTAHAPDQQPIKEVDVASVKRTPSPAFQAYPSDFLSDDKVCRMSFTEIGVYWVMLCHAWNACGLPANTELIAKTIKMPHARFVKMWEGVLGECWFERGGRLFNPRQEKERQKQQAFSRRQSDNATKRWESHGNATAVPASVRRTAGGNASLSRSHSQSLKKDVSTEQKHPSANHPIKAFLSLYEDLFLALNGHKPIIHNGRDAKIAQRTIAALGEAEAERLLRAFFSTTDPFILNAGHGLNVFAGQINKLLETPKSNPSAPGSRTAGNVAALQAFVDRGRVDD